jgi:hypothetical protein
VGTRATISFFRRSGTGTITLAAIAATLLILAAAVAVTAPWGADGLWGGVLSRIDWNAEPYRFVALRHDGAFYVASGWAAAEGLAAAGVTFALLAALWNLLAVWRWAGVCIGALAVVEALVFARMNRPAMDTADVGQYVTQVRLATAPLGDGRIYSPGGNLILAAGGSGIWGSDPMILARYAAFLAAGQDTDPDSLLTHGLSPNPMWVMLRCDHLLEPVHRTLVSEPLPFAALPRAGLYTRIEVIPDAAARLKRLADPTFDPFLQLVLDGRPDVIPAPTTQSGTVRVTDVSSDELEITADAPADSILLITDNYASGWVIEPLAGDLPQAYEIIPADHTLRGVPLKAGRHHFRMIYRPAAVTAGMWTSIVSLLAYAGALGIVAARRSRVRAISRAGDLACGRSRVRAIAHAGDRASGNRTSGDRAFGRVRIRRTDL